MTETIEINIRGTQEQAIANAHSYLKQKAIEKAYWKEQHQMFIGLFFMMCVVFSILIFATN